MYKYSFFASATVQAWLGCECDRACHHIPEHTVFGNF